MSLTRQVLSKSLPPHRRNGYESRFGSAMVGSCLGDSHKIWGQAYSCLKCDWCVDQQFEIVGAHAAQYFYPCENEAPVNVTMSSKFKNHDGTALQAACIDQSESIGICGSHLLCNKRPWSPLNGLTGTSYWYHLLGIFAWSDYFDGGGTTLW